MRPARIPAENCPQCGEVFHPYCPGTGELCRRCQYNNALSTPVPVSEGSQVSGEVGPASGVVAGSNQAATGAGNGPGGVVPVPVAAQSWDPTSPQHAVIRAAIAWRDAFEGTSQSAAQTAEDALVEAVDELPHIGEPVPVVAQPRYVLDVAGVLGLISQYAEACVEAATTGSPKAKDNALERREEVRHAIRAALTPVPDVEPEPAWGSGPLVDHNLETPAPATCDTCDGKGVIACYGAYPGGPTACIDCHGTGEMPCPDCPGTGSADPDGWVVMGRPDGPSLAS